MIILSVLHLPSLCFVLTALFLGVCARGSIQNMVRAARDSSLMIGSQGTLIALVLMLQDIEDSSDIGMALSTSLLTILYGLMFYVCLNALLGYLGPAEPNTLGPKELNAFTALGLAGLFGAIATSILMSTNLLNFINVEIIVLFVGSIVLAFWSSKGSGNSLASSIAQYSLWTGAVGVLLSYILWLSSLNDPTAVGPNFALGILSLFYCGFLYTAAQFVQASIFQKGFVFGPMVNVGYAIFVLAYITFDFLMPILFMGL